MGPLWGWAFVVSDEASVTSYIWHCKALIDVCYGFANVFNLIFDYPNFGKGVPLGVDDDTVG